MSSSPAQASDPYTPLTADELSQALKVEVYDEDGKSKTLGELTKGRRTALAFTRHFWCVNCQNYVRYLSDSVPPSNLPANTQILVIGCGSYQPIKTYAAQSASKYPIYTDPTLRLHEILNFKYSFSTGEKGDEQRDYMRDAGSVMARVWSGVKMAVGRLDHVNYVGPKSLNGGEVVISADGQCEYSYRMQNTVDHTHVSKLAALLGAQTIPADAPPQPQHDCGCEEPGPIKA